MKLVLILNLGLRLRQAHSTQVKCFSAVALSAAKNCQKFNNLIPNRNITKNHNWQKFQDLMHRNFCAPTLRRKEIRYSRLQSLSVPFSSLRVKRLTRLVAQHRRFMLRLHLSDFKMNKQNNRVAWSYLNDPSNDFIAFLVGT